MKMKFISIATALIAVIAFSACSSESPISTQEAEQSMRASVSFNITVPKGDPITYGLQDASESQIKNLYLYEFDCDKNVIGSPVNILADLTPTSDGYTYKRTIAMADKGQRYFYLVANENQSIATLTTINELTGRSAAELLSSNTSCSSLLYDDALVMTGIATKYGSELIALTNDGVSINVNLTRVVARLDIENKMAGLEITDICLSKTNDKSHLFLNESGNSITLPVDVKQVNKILPYSALPSPLFDKGQSMSKAFYLYEGNQLSEAEAVHIDVTGTLSGVPVFYSIPFWKEGQEVAVQRNHLYHLVLGDGTETAPDVVSNASFTLTDSPWNEETVAHGFSIFSASYTAVSGTSYDAQKQLLTVSNAAYTDLTFVFTNQFLHPINYVATVTDAPSWITVRVSGDQVILTVTANNAADAASREALVKVSNGVDPTTTYSILVQQNN